MIPPFPPRDRHGFEIAIICALPLEANAVIALFDHHWEDEKGKYGKVASDPNAYTTGVIGTHNVVVAHMPGTGKVSAAGVAVGLRVSFPNVNLALVVGICGGVPYGPHHRRDIYLGDVIVSQCLIQYDFGRQYPKLFEPKDTVQGSLGVTLQSVLRKLETDYHIGRMQKNTWRFLKEVQGKSGRAVFPGVESDQLFEPSYLHQHRDPTDCAMCEEDGTQVCGDALAMTCRDLGCEGEGLVHRKRPVKQEEEGFPPSIHMGNMGSGDTVMKSGTHRDEIARRDRIIGFEMEGAGVSAHFPSLVIKGVSDYADSHKNKQWQDYAAATAAACTKAFLKGWALESTYNNSNVPELPTKPVFMVDITRDDTLVGREDVMQSVTDKLSIEGHSRVALVALGGIGKTRIALEYALGLRNSPVSVFWIYASTKARILESYAKIAKRVNILGYKEGEDDRPLLLKEWFESDASGRWLIILDNADDHDVLYGPNRLVDIFPRSENGSILMTTRDKKVGFDFAGASRLLRLQPLNSNQAQELLVSKMGDEIDVECCTALCDELEGIPLAIVQASAYMHQNSITAEEYLETYQESSVAQIELLSENFEDTLRDRDIKNPIATTWFISFEHIDRTIPLAGELLRRMSIVDSQAIPLSLIQTQEPRPQLTKALGTLQAFCLITARVSTSGKPKQTDKSYDLHRLVRLAVRNWMKQRDLLCLQTARTLRIVSTNYPDVESTGWKEIDVCRAYLPHAVVLLSSDELQGSGRDVVAPAFLGQGMIGGHSPDNVHCAACAGDLMMNLSFTFEYFEQKMSSIDWAVKAVSLRTFSFGEEHQCTIEALIRAANGYYNIGQTQDARKFGEKAVRLIDTTNQPQSLVAWQVEIIGWVQDEDGMSPIDCFQKALEMRIELFGPDHPDVIRTKDNLSGFYCIQGNYAESDRLLKETIESHTRTSGPASPGALKAMSSLAFNYAVSGRADEAMALNAQVATLEANLSELRHAELIMVLQYRSVSHYRLGRYSESAEWARESLKISSRLNGPDSRESTGAMNMIAFCYQRQGRVAEAEELRIRAMKSTAKIAGEESSFASESMRELADLYTDEERYNKAEPLREKLVALETKRLGRQSPEAILSMCELGLNYSCQGLHHKAGEYRYSALNYPVGSPQAKLPRNVRRMAAIALTLSNNDNHIEAEKIGRDAVGLFRLHERPTQYHIISVLTSIAYVCGSLNKTQEAEELYQEALDLMNSQGAIHTDLPSCLTRLASVLLQEARYNDAEIMALEAKEKLSELPEPETLVVAFNTRTLATAYAEQGHYREAETLFSDILEQHQDEAWKHENLRLPSIVGSLNVLEALAQIYALSERYQQAERIYKTTLAVRNRLKGATNLHTFKITALYRDALNSQARYTEALELGLDCKMRLIQGAIEDTSYSQMIVGSIYRGIAISYLGLGKYTYAEPLAREALETTTRNIGPNNPQSLDCLAALASILREQDDKRLVEVQEIDTRVLEGWTRIVGEKHLKTIAAMEASASTYEKQGNKEEAENLREKAKVLRSGLDHGLDGDEKTKLDDLVSQALRKWDENEDLVTAAIQRLNIG